MHLFRGIMIKIQSWMLVEAITFQPPVQIFNRRGIESVRVSQHQMRVRVKTHSGWWCGQCANAFVRFCSLAELQKALFQSVVLNQNILQCGLHAGSVRVCRASGTVETGDTGHLCCSSVCVWGASLWAFQWAQGQVLISRHVCDALLWN